MDPVELVNLVKNYEHLVIHPRERRRERRQSLPGCPWLVLQNGVEGVRVDDEAGGSTIIEGHLQDRRTGR